MFPTRAAMAGLVAATALVSACAPAVHSAAPAEPVPSVCTDSLYLRLRSAEPDDLSEREWTRLQQLEQQCLAERQAPAAGQAPGEKAADSGSMHRAGWLWMPAMMVFGGLMWLMMGG